MNNLKGEITLGHKNGQFSQFVHDLVTKELGIMLDLKMIQKYVALLIALDSTLEFCADFLPGWFVHAPRIYLHRADGFTTFDSGWQQTVPQQTMLSRTMQRQTMLPRAMAGAMIADPATRNTPPGVRSR